MAYLDTTGATPRERLTAIGATGLVNAGIGTALVLGLATSATFVTPPPNPRATDIPNFPIEPPPPKPKPEKIQEAPKNNTAVSEITTVKTPFDLSDRNPVKRPVSKPAEDTTPLPTGEAPENTQKPQPEPPIAKPIEPPIPTPVPMFTPKGPVPLGNPGSWVTANDYPSSDLRRGSEGTTRFNLTISQSGRVTGCRVTQSSGHSRLDRSACSKVERRARFRPATDEKGANVSGTYSSAVRWEIPK